MVKLVTLPINLGTDRVQFNLQWPAGANYNYATKRCEIRCHLVMVDIMVDTYE